MIATVVRTMLTTTSCVAVRPVESVRVNVMASKPVWPETGLIVRTSDARSIAAVKRDVSTSITDHTKSFPSAAGPSEMSFS